jgi:hypothetical protein
MNETDFYKNQYQEWLATQDLSDNPIDTDELREQVGVFLKAAQGQDVREYTLLRKYNQLNNIYQPETITDVFGDESRIVPKGLKHELKVKNNIWMPEHPDDYLDLEPELLLCNNNVKYNKIYNVLRLFISTGENNNNIGRNLYYIVRDKITKKYLGNVNLSSDYLDVKGRDEWIGWSREEKTKSVVTNTCIASTLVPTQPLGYNYVGGKLLSLLAITEQVQHDWHDMYGDKLVAVGTTSLYGSFSQYTGLKYWKSMGKSVGATTARPDLQLMTDIRTWLKYEHTDKYWEWYYAKKPNGMNWKRDHINRSLAYAYGALGFKRSDFITNHARGIYFCPLYENTRDFLRKEISEKQLVKRFDNSLPAMVELWKTKYASKRIKNLVNQNRCLSDTLFYDDLLYMNWPKAKETYLPQVGR